MSETVDTIITHGAAQMDIAVEHLKKELTKIRTGKANTGLLDGLLVDYYGNNTPLAQVANVGIADARTITIQPWEKSMLAKIEQSIFAANIGITPMNDGEIIRISIPPLTEERRRDLAKQAKTMGEEAKVALRHARHKIIDFIKKAMKDGFPEDMGKRKEAEVDKMLHHHSEAVDHLISAKEKDIMTV
ncbi:MAG TPA: ribosome recycling factor [Saprospiraceae bacterium]|nr:ribosome recycling factor [Saprospiraceae bacterium]